MEQIKIHDLHQYHFLNNLKSWEKADFFTFVKTQTDLDNNTYQHVLYQSDGTNHKAIYTFDKSSQHFIYDNNHILIPSTDEDKNNVLKKINLETKLCTKEIETPYAFSNLEPLNKEGVFLASVYHNPKKEEYDDTLFEIIETIPFQSNGSGFTQGKINQLFLVNLEKETYTAITSDDMTVFSYTLNQDKTKVYITASDDLDVFSFYPDLYVYDFEKEKLELLTDQKELSIGNLIPLHEKLFVSASSKKEHGVNQNADFYEFKNGAFEKVCDFGLSMWASIGSDVRFGGNPSTYLDTDAFYFTGTYHHSNRVYAFDGQKVDVIYTSQGSIDGWIPFKDKVIGIALQKDKLQELYRFDPKNKNYQVISKFNDEALANKYIAIPQHITYENDGQALDGWIMYPYGYEEGQTYPAILDIHGGPKTIYSDVFYHEMQVWAVKVILFSLQTLVVVMLMIMILQIFVVNTVPSTMMI